MIYVVAYVIIGIGVAVSTHWLLEEEARKAMRSHDSDDLGSALVIIGLAWPLWILLIAWTSFVEWMQSL
jgi:hypothetical protein